MIGMRPSLAVLNALVLLVSILMSLPAVAHPKVFSDLSLAQAQEKAKQTNKLVVADFMAEWCGPCRMMDEDTWKAPAVEKWLGANALAVQIDVDAQPALAKSLGINAMPTIIVFAPPDVSKERDREVGYKDADELIDWLDGIKGGRVINKETAKYDRAKGRGGLQEARARLEQAEKLMSMSDFAGATDEYIWLWNNVANEAPNLMPMRDTVIVAAMTDLAKQYEPAKAKFEELRATAREMDKTFDWVLLNDITGHQDDTLAWYDAAKNDSNQRPAVQDLEPRIIDLLLEKGRYAEAGRIWKDPRAELRNRFDWCQAVRRDAEDHPNLFPNHAGLMYSALLAAGRNKEAEQIARDSLQLEDSSDMRNELSAARQRVSPPGIFGLPWWLVGTSAVVLLLLILALMAILKRKQSA